MKAYVLEDLKEAERLERQSQNELYSYQNELRDFVPVEDGIILDAGCGSGIVSRYLSSKYSKARVIGCDFSLDRVNFCKNHTERYENLSYQFEDLSKLTFETASIDSIVLRYVIEHFPEVTRNAVLPELFRVLRPNSHIHVVDTDGFILNSFPQTPLVQKVCHELNTKKPIDLNIGRKIPYFLEQAGFVDIQWRVETQVFQDEALEFEKKMLEERLQQSLPFLGEFLGSKSTALTFTLEYLENLNLKNSVLFYNKFIVNGKKPGLRIQK